MQMQKVKFLCYKSVWFCQDNQREEEKQQSGNSKTVFALLPTSPLYLIKQQKPSLIFSSQNLLSVHSLIGNVHPAMMIWTVLNDSLNRNLVCHFHPKICFECTPRALQMHLFIWEPHLSFTTSQNDSFAFNIAPQSILRFFFNFYWIFLHFKVARSSHGWTDAIVVGSTM